MSFLLQSLSDLWNVKAMYCIHRSTHHRIRKTTDPDHETPVLYLIISCDVFRLKQ